MKRKTLSIALAAAALGATTYSTEAAAGDPVLGALVGGAAGAAIGGPPGAAVGAIIGTIVGAADPYYRHHRRHGHYAPRSSYYEREPVHYRDHPRRGYEPAPRAYYEPRYEAPRYYAAETRRWEQPRYEPRYEQRYEPRYESRQYRYEEPRERYYEDRYYEPRYR